MAHNAPGRTLLVLVAVLASGCQTAPPPDATGSSPDGLDTVRVTFRLPASAPEGVQVWFPVLWGPLRRDDVAMTRTATGYEAVVELPEGALVHYGYRVGTYDWEHRELVEANVEPTRILVVSGPQTIEDEIYAFGTASVARPAEAFGRITDAVTGAPVLDPVIVADGLPTMALDGHYWLAVRDRPQWVTVYTLDGSYQPQTRRVTPGQQDFQLTPAAPATVTLRPAADLPAHHRLRVAGTAEQLGDTQLLADRFTWEGWTEVTDELVLPLHEGQWVDYVYTVANSAQSFEHRDGRAVVRSLVAHDGLVVEDDVGPFLGDDVRTLTVRVPDYTDPGEPIGVSGFDPRIQRLHPVGDGTWTLSLSNGGFREGSTYRYYRSWQGAGDEPTIERTLGPTDRVDEVDDWKYQRGPIPAYDVDVPPIANPFQVWAEFPDWWSNNHAFLAERMVAGAAAQGFHAVMPAQVWGYQSLEPTPRLVRNAPQTLYTPQYELERVARMAHERGLQVVVRPQTGFDSADMPSDGTFDLDWWRAWLVEIERFNVHMARSAAAADVDVLSIVGRHPFWAMPPEFLAEYDTGMEAIIAKMRDVYAGKLIAIHDKYVGDLTTVDHWSQADYIFATAHNMAAAGDSQAEIDAEVERLMDQEFRPEYEQAGRPLILSLGVYSVDGAATGVQVPESDGPHTERNKDYPLDVEEQRRIYDAFFRAANERPWVAGFELFVHSPVPQPETRDVTITGKPAEAVASAWARAITAAGDGAP